MCNPLTASETGIQKKQCLEEISVAKNQPSPLPAMPSKTIAAASKDFSFGERLYQQVRCLTNQSILLAESTLCARALFMLFFTHPSLCCRRFDCDNAKETYSLLLNPRSLPSPPQKSIFNRPPPPRLVLPPCSRCPISRTLSLHPQLRCFSL